MATQYLDKLGDLIKALEAGFAVGPPGSLTQGAALQRQDLSPVMNLVTFGEQKIKLQKELPIEKATSTTVEFNRQLDYGIPGGSATLEVSAGQDDTANYVRALVQWRSMQIEELFHLLPMLLNHSMVKKPLNAKRKMRQ